MPKGGVVIQDRHTIRDEDQRDMRAVSDSDTIRRQNRGLVLDAIRRNGPTSRTRLASETGLSHATITAITTDMVGQGVVTEQREDNGDQKTRGRPAVLVGFKREAGYALLIEIDVNKARFSLVDYDGVIVDRTETPLTPASFNETPPLDFLVQRVQHIRQRNPEAAPRILRIAASLQGILARDAKSLKWSPVQHLTGHDLAGALQDVFNLPVTLIKRGRLLADGTKLLFPHLREANIATVFVGSTIGMGISFLDRRVGRSDDAATEFGHMNHQPDGALCRCGMRGCIEAYAADYGILRTAYGVPGRTPPAATMPPSQYTQLIERAHAGDRDAVHAFNIAGQALGYGLNRMMALFEPSHIVFVGPGANAFDLMRPEFETALASSLVAREQGIPEILTYNDENEPIFKGLLNKTLVDIDQTDFAALPSLSTRMEAR